jgi:hypothetical protein
VNVVEWAEANWLVPETGKLIKLGPWQRKGLLALFPAVGSPSTISLELPLEMSRPANPKVHRPQREGAFHSGEPVSSGQPIASPVGIERLTEALQRGRRAAHDYRQRYEDAAVREAMGSESRSVSSGRSRPRMRSAGRPGQRT